jgi:hypothetical protein
MTTLAPFRLSVTSAGSTGSAGPTPPDEHVVLDFSGDTHLDRGAYADDRKSGNFDLLWTSLADFERWREEQCRLYSIELLLAKTRGGVNYDWKRVYRCGREGTGGKKKYQKKNAGQARKIGSKRTGCPCQVVVKAYPSTDTLLGKYITNHDHPIGIQNLIYTRVSANAKGKARELLQQGVGPRQVVCNCRFCHDIG